MAKPRIKLNNKGFAELRNSKEVRAELDRIANRVANAAGDGFEARPASPGTKSNRSRARASVGTTNYASRRRQSRDGVLQRALDAGRG